MIRVALIALAAGCATSEPAIDRTTLGPLELAVPSGWHARELSRPDQVMTMWTPDDNPGRESIVVIRTRSMPELSDAGPATVRHLLDEALRGLPRERFGPPIQTRSAAGLLGVMADGTFVPRDHDQPHRRIHAVLFEGTSLVHVMFTAGAADASAEPFDIVFNSLRRKDG